MDRSDNAHRSRYSSPRRSPLPDASVLEQRTSRRGLRQPQPASRRLPEAIYFRRRVAALSLLAFLLLLVVLLAGIFGPRGTTFINGDQLGPDPDEPLTSYQERSAAALAEVAGEKDARYALVTFARPLSASDASQAVEGIQRVGAVVDEQNLIPVALPEPVAPETRAEVFTRAVGRDRISAVVVWDTPQALGALAENTQVLAVEPAPVDAAWGGFAIRPVISDSQ